MPLLPDRSRTRVLVVSLAALGGAVLVAGALAAWASSNGEGSAAQDAPSVGLMHVGTGSRPSLARRPDPAARGGIRVGSPGSRRQALPGGEAKELRPRGREPPAHVEESGQVGGREPGGGVRRPGSRLIVAFEDQSIQAAQKATVESQTPVVFLHPNDPVRDGLVDSLANPGTNLTGVFGARDLVAKHLEYFTLLIPDIERVLALVEPGGLELRVSADGDAVRGRAARSRAGGPGSVGCRGHPASVPVARAGRGRRSHAAVVEHSGSTIRLSPSGSGSVRACRCRRTGRTGWSRERSSPTAPISYPIGVEAARYIDGILDGAAPSRAPVKEIPEIELRHQPRDCTPARDQGAEANDHPG